MKSTALLLFLLIMPIPAGVITYAVRRHNFFFIIFLQLALISTLWILPEIFSALFGQGEGVGAIRSLVVIAALPLVEVALFIYCCVKGVRGGKVLPYLGGWLIGVVGGAPLTLLVMILTHGRLVI